MIAAGVAAALAGVVYLGWRWAVASECAWVSPAVQDWLDAGVRPAVTDGCPLRPGTTVTGSVVESNAVTLSIGQQDPVVMPLVPSGPLVLQRLAAAASSLLFCLGFFGLALYAALRRSGDRGAAATVVLSGALLGSTLVTMVGLPVHTAFAGPIRWAFMALTMPLFLLAWGAGLAWLLVFPQPLRGVRRVGAAQSIAMAAPVAVWAAAAAVLLAVSGSFTGWMHAAIIVQSSLTVTAIAAMMAILAVRLRHSLRTAPGSVPRQQLLWVAGSALVTGLLTLSLWMVPSLLTGLPLLPEEAIGAPGLIFVAGFGIAILRYRIFDLDTVLARTLVYAGLTLAAVLVYLITSAALAAGFGALAPAQVAVSGAVLAAVIVNPLRVRLERRVNRTLYGDRDDPYSALSRVAAKVSEGGVAGGQVAGDIRKALRAPYVAVVRDDGEPVESGDASALLVGSVEFPLEHAGQRVGSLRVAVRGPGERFAKAERRLLADIARQLGAGLHEEGLARQLQLSREQIVTAREEERRALRRTLHDEIGPTLAALSLRTETVRRTLAGDRADTGAAAAALAGISADAAAAAESLRRLSYDLRPPALDELGLVGALQRFAAGVAEVEVTVAADDGQDAAGPPLSAAAEAAVYRIAVAAVDNAVKHARASRCVITLTRSGGRVAVTVADDGAGRPPDSAHGVGITSMRERAAELGGSLTVADGNPGTVVRAVIPTAARQDGAVDRADAPMEQRR